MFAITLGRPQGTPIGAPLFTGAVTMRKPADELGTSQLTTYDVQFQVDGRTVWHTHDKDQLIVVVSGSGIVATDDQELLVRPGDVVLVPAGERHWHGATRDSAMSHFTVMLPGGNTEVLEPVDPVTVGRGDA
jgi:quercetin dioxygenase-like cupin family protein